MRLERRNLRIAELIHLDKEANDELVEAAIERSKTLDTTLKGKYSLWRRDFENPNSESTLKLIRDQIIMAKAYANLAKSMNESTLYSSLMMQSRRSRHAIGEASSDAELHPRYIFMSPSTLLITRLEPFLCSHGSFFLGFFFKCAGSGNSNGSHSCYSKG